jgi:tRNA 2-thiouridine synthesizing protein A
VPCAGTLCEDVVDPILINDGARRIGWRRTMNFDKELDTRGLNCPLPILRTKKSLSDMQSGQVLKVMATDPGSVKDFQAFSKQTGNELLSSDKLNSEFIFYMKKK